MTSFQREFHPSKQLANSVRFLFHFEVDLKTLENVTPDGSIEISFNLRRDSISGDSCYILSRFSKVRRVRPCDLGEVIGVSLFPWAVRSFLKVPAYE